MGYTFKSSDVWDFAQAIQADCKQKGDELFFTYCPRCHGGSGNLLEKELEAYKDFKNERQKFIANYESQPRGATHGKRRKNTSYNR